MNLKKIFFPRAYLYQSQSYPVHYAINHITRKGKRIEYIHFDQSNEDLVILCHPYLIEAKDYFLQSGHIDMYTEMGYDVVIFDFNGFGNSDDIDIELHRDLSLLSLHFKKKKNYKNIYGHGLSMGAAMVINSTHNDAHGINKIIIENCLDTTPSYFKKRNKKLYYLIRTINFIFPPLAKYVFYYKDVTDLRDVSAVMYIYNDEDDLTTVEMGKRLYAATKTPAEFHILKGTHLSAIDTDQDRYKKLISSFLNS